MRRALARAGWGLLATGVLSAATPAPGQVTAAGYPVMRGPHGEILQVIHTSVAAPVSEEQMAAESMTVELAWLADQTFYSYDLVAYVTHGVMEVRGYVPNDAVRAQALAVARAHTSLVVVDDLKLHPSLAMRSAGEPADAVRLAASEVLLGGFPQHATSFAIQVEPGGQVVLSGVVPSLQEKLAISRALRRVRGFRTCVLNQLEVVNLYSETARQHPDPAGPRLVPTPANSGAVVRKQHEPATAALAHQATANDATAGPPLPPEFGSSMATPSPFVEGVVIQTSATAPAETPPPKKKARGAHATADEAKKTVPAPAATAPYVSTGVVLLPDNDAPSDAGGTATKVPEPVRRHIEGVCDGVVHDVEVVALAPEHLEVRGKVKSKSERDRLSSTILALPDLVKYQITFQLQVEP